MAQKSKNKNNNRIPATSDVPISFSFRFYDGADRKYCISQWEKEKIALSLTRLKQINEKTYNEMAKDGVTMHFHQVDWAKTKKPKGFPNGAKEVGNPFQFELLGINSGKARVYGALNSAVFHIVWFDFNHEIWPTFRT
jgi:hypothetical protein